MHLPTPAASRDPWNQPTTLWAARIAVGGVVAWIVHRVWAGLSIPWWFNTDELVFFNEIIRQLRLDPGQTFFDIPGTPYTTLCSGLTAAWWGFERLFGLSQAANPSDFAFEQVQGVYGLMRAVTLGCYATAIGLAFSAFRQAGGVLTGVLAAILAATLPIHVQYSHFVRTESLGLVLCFSAILLLLHPRTARRWTTYLVVGILCGIAMSARFHFALVGLPVVLALYFFHDRPQLDLADEKLPRQRLFRAGTALAGLFIVGAVITLLFRNGIIPASGITHMMLLSTAEGAAQFPGAKQAVAKLWLLLGTGGLGLLLAYQIRAVRPRLTPFINAFTVAIVLGFAGGFLCSHPAFLWRGEHQLRSIQFYSDWVDPNLEKLGLWGSWWNVTHYYFTTALPEKWLQFSFLAGVGTILWSRNPLSISFLLGAALCFVAHPVTMKLWAHHIIPWLPLLCFVAAHPIGTALRWLTRKWPGPILPPLLVTGTAALLIAVLPARLAKADDYVKTSLSRTTQIDEMYRWLAIHVPLDSFLAVSYYSLNGDGFLKWIESTGVTVPKKMTLFPHTRIWWLQRSILDGRSGYVCISRADIQFFREDAELKQPGSTYDPFTDKIFEELATFGGGAYELKVFKFDLRHLPLGQPDVVATVPTPPPSSVVTDTSVTELKKKLADLQARVDTLVAEAQRQAAYTALLKTAHEQLEKAHAVLQRQQEQQLAVTKQQSDYIAALEKERDQLKASPDAVRQQVENLNRTAREQAAYIEALKKEIDRLTAQYANHGKDIAHYLKVINEQTAYIKLLESERKPPAQP